MLRPLFMLRVIRWLKALPKAINELLDTPIGRYMTAFAGTFTGTLAVRWVCSLMGF